MGHRHLHVLLIDGGFLPHGTFGRLLYFDSEKMQRLFRTQELRLWVKKELVGENAVSNMLCWRHRGFSVDGSVRVETNSDALSIGRYRMPQSDSSQTFLWPLLWLSFPASGESTSEDALSEVRWMLEQVGSYSSSLPASPGKP